MKASNCNRFTYLSVGQFVYCLRLSFGSIESLREHKLGCSMVLSCLEYEWIHNCEKSWSDMTLNYWGDSREVPIYKWSGWQFISCCEIFSLLDKKKLARQERCQELTHYNKVKKLHLTIKRFLSRVKPTGSNSHQIAQCRLFIYLCEKNSY